MFVSLSACQTNQKAAYLDKHRTADFRLQIELAPLIQSRESETDPSFARNPISQPETNQN